MVVEPLEHLPGDTAAGKQSFTELMDKVMNPGLESRGLQQG